MKKRILSLLMVMCMFVTLLPVTALAVNEGPLLRVSGSGISEYDKNYNTFTEFFNATLSMISNGSSAGSYTVLLLRDAEIEVENIGIMIFGSMGDASVVFDLGGHTLTATGSGMVIATTGNDAFVKNGILQLNESGLQGIVNTNGVTSVENVVIKAAENTTNSVGMAVNLQGGHGGDIKIKNCVVLLGESNSDLINGDNNNRKIIIESGQFSEYPITEGDGGIKCADGSRALASNLDNVTGTVITSPDTTAIIVDDGNAYLYDSLQDAVDAVEPGETIQLLKQPEEESVTVPTDADFRIVSFDGASVDVDKITFATERGYQVVIGEDGWISVEEADVPVAGISLNKTRLTLTRGDTAALTATVEPADATDRTVTWSSDDDTVATVDQKGKVVAVGVGETSITAEAGDASAVCTVTVTPKQSERPDDEEEDEPAAGSIISVSGTAHGSVRVNPGRAEKGDTVTITAIPDDGYELGGLTVTDRDGGSVRVSDAGNNRYTFTMPGGSVTVKAEFVQDGTAAPVIPGASFADVPEDFWAYNEINWAAENGYMNGTTTTTFDPNGTVTRQQVWMILARMAGARPADMAEAKTWAVENGISDGTNPGAAVTRQQLVALLYRFAAHNGYDTTARADLSGYPDAASVASYATDAMAWAVAGSIVGGTTQGTLDPAGTANRAQFAVILWRFYQTTAI